MKIYKSNFKIKFIVLHCYLHRKKKYFSKTHVRNAISDQTLQTKIKKINKIKSQNKNHRKKLKQIKSINTFTFHTNSKHIISNHLYNFTINKNVIN